VPDSVINLSFSLENVQRSCVV